MNKKNPITILITSNEPWGNIWFSKQHYANELTKLGFTVYFINPTSKWNLKNIFSFKANLSQTAENITLINYQNTFPQIIFKSFFTKLNDKINLIKINQIVNLNNPNLIWWKFEPYRFLNTYPFKKCKTIYHAVDPYNFLWQDPIQVSNADLVVCTNPKYYEYYRENYKSKEVVLIPHGISEDEFENDSEKISAIKNRYGKFVILIGSITVDMNFDLLKIIAEHNIKLIILGQETSKIESWEKLKSHKNILYLGEVHAKEIKNYIAAASAGLIAYNFNNTVTKNSRTPLKIMNYLAQNKPIITSVKTTLNTLENQCIYNANNSDEYLLLLQKAQNNELKVNTESINMYLSNHKYPILIKQILTQLN